MRENPPAPINPSPSRLRGLDAMRGLAALAVVLYHYGHGYEVVAGPRADPPTWFFRHGYLGVEAFFLVSGFVILHTLERCADWRDFALARFARLYPPFLAAAAITLTVVFGLGFNPLGIGAADVLASSTLVPAALGGRMIDPSHWTLMYEVLFYGLAGLAWFGLGVRRVEWACLAWLAVGRAGAAYDVELPFMGNFSYLFVLGMMILRVSRGDATPLTAVTAAAAFAVCLALPEGPLGPWAPLVVALLALAVLAAATGRLGPLEARPLLFLGDVSYSLYLVHQIAGYALIRHLEAAGLGADLAIVVTTLAAVAAAAVLRHAVELPAQRALRGLGWRRFRIGRAPGRVAA